MDFLDICRIKIICHYIFNKIIEIEEEKNDC